MKKLLSALIICSPCVHASFNDCPQVSYIDWSSTIQTCDKQVSDLTNIVNNQTIPTWENYVTQISTALAGIETTLTADKNTFSDAYTLISSSADLINQVDTTMTATLSCAKSGIQTLEGQITSCCNDLHSLITQNASDESTLQGQLADLKESTAQEIATLTEKQAQAQADLTTVTALYDRVVGKNGAIATQLLSETSNLIVQYDEMIGQKQQLLNQITALEAAIATHQTHITPILTDAQALCQDSANHNAYACDAPTIGTSVCTTGDLH